MDVTTNIEEVEEVKDPEEERRRRRRKTLIEDVALIVALIAAVIIGICLGVGLRTVWTPDDKRKIFYLKFPGQLLLNMLKCLILPLVVSSLITATAALDKNASGRLGLGAIIYYLSTTLVAVIIGIVLVLAIHPGDPDDLDKIQRKGSSKDTKPLDALLDLIRNCFPPNLVTAAFEREVTVIDVTNKSIIVENETSGLNWTEFRLIDAPKLTDGSGMNVLGLVVFSVALGCVINHLQERGKPLMDFFEALNDATMVLVKLVIWYSPIGIIFLIASQFVETDDVVAIAARLGMYMLTVLAGLAIHAFLVLPLLYFLATRKNPGVFALNMLKAICTAWGTASSSATLPVTMECLVQKNKVNERIVRFVAPIGATINMDGTALYEAVASIFIAQVNGISLGVADVIIVSLTATAAAIGAAGVPQAGLVTMVIVLTAVNLPTEDVTLILAIDWFLDRFRTAVNVWGDSVGAGILNHIFRNLFPAKGDSSAFLPIPASETSDSPSFDSTRKEKNGPTTTTTTTTTAAATTTGGGHDRGHVNPSFQDSTTKL
ncbi:excitatory amino acid transporter 3-like [Babylonia areolata]|uniref:excitatory amino acid transporter 3-like n=1 Tax=Babylonia areolata TaxID=304850 RepID=UPI003FD6BDA9